MAGGARRGWNDSARGWAVGCLAVVLMLMGIATEGRAQAVATTRQTDGTLESYLGGLATEDAAARKAAIDGIGHSRDMRGTALLEAFGAGNLYTLRGQVVLVPKIEAGPDGVKTGAVLDPLTLAPVLADGKPQRAAAAELKSISPSRRERTLVRDALTLLRFSDPDPDARLAAIIKAGDGGNEAALGALKELEKGETDRRVKGAIGDSVALIELSSADPRVKLAAADELGRRGLGRALSRLQELSAAEQDAAAKATYAAAIERIESWQSKARWVSNVFSGLSLGSILILMALGLSVIFGLMGVINMAHGELMMIGAYATFLVQQAFVRWASPGAFDWYFLAAIPVSFLVAAIVGALLEMTLIRHLYGRPLETLLATWGVGLVLIQAVRLWFGDNIAVNSPTWLQKGFAVATDITLPYNRCFIIGFCLACVVAMYVILERTPLGLLIRATMQNRTMAAALGVRTRRVDTYTFALGAGLAGLAGCALTQIGGVTPDMGQNYIVDSFMVVVTGGVGKLAGAIWAGLGLGTANKLIEPIVQSVWAKVLILLFVVVFIQFKPSGLFPAKGRNADA